MAKKEKSVPKPAVKVQEKTKPVKPHYFPRLLFLFGIAVGAIGVIDYFQWFSFSRILLDVVLLFAGLWILFLALAKGSSKHRKEVLKRYI
ncbi:hypothetical protein COV17_01710 [Candidatus Woesearchaeota archaeon CG10_big_fil_rev_8_21_14_0_10_36_11]|nr:MAG: hypothetical protein COV17_01710 [Candidatus Woesearchaeota archaeon CG10_big_fil_rev_8_21_14_0_10_36_11]